MSPILLILVVLILFIILIAAAAEPYLARLTAVLTAIFLVVGIAAGLSYLGLI